MALPLARASHKILEVDILRPKVILGRVHYRSDSSSDKVGLEGYFTSFSIPFGSQFL